MSDERRSVRSEIARDLVESLVERIELDPWIPDALRQDYPELTGRLSAVLRRPLAAAPAEAQQAVAPEAHELAANVKAWFEDLEAHGCGILTRSRDSHAGVYASGIHAWQMYDLACVVLGAPLVPQPAAPQPEGT